MRGGTRRSLLGETEREPECATHTTSALFYCSIEYGHCSLPSTWLLHAIGRRRPKDDDLVSVAEAEAPADVVTLDRVICCYHDMVDLVTPSAETAPRLYGAVCGTTRPNRPAHRAGKGYLISLGSFPGNLRRSEGSA